MTRHPTLTRLLVTAALLLTAGCTTPPAPPPAPTVFQPDGTLVVAHPRTTTDVDPCTLLTPEDLQTTFGPRTRTVLVDSHTCSFFRPGRYVDRLSLTLDQHPIGVPLDPPQSGVIQNALPDQIIVGNAGRSGCRSQSGCQLTIALDRRPAASSLSLISKDDDSLDELRRLAELIVERLPRSNW